MVRVVLPLQLRRLAKVESEVALELSGHPTPHSIVSALEERYPMLKGTVRDHVTLQRRPMVRYYACGEDYSHEPPDTPLPDSIATGAEPFLIVGAMAGG